MRTNDQSGAILAGCALVFISFNLTIGTIAFQWCLWSLFGKDIPLWADVICGLISAQVAVPLAIILFDLYDALMNEADAWDSRLEKLYREFGEVTAEIDDDDLEDPDKS